MNIEQIFFYSEKKEMNITPISSRRTTFRLMHGRILKTKKQEQSNIEKKMEEKRKMIRRHEYKQSRIEVVALIKIKLFILFK